MIRTTSTIISTPLSEVYADWLHTQHLLRVSKDQLSGLEKNSVHILLENIVMHRLLNCSQPTVRTLFQGVERPSILAGFEAINTSPTDEWITTIEALFTSSWGTENHEPKITLDTHAIRVGTFIQPLVAPVSRLLNVAKQLYSESEALYYVSRCALRYASIYAKTRHIGPPQIVYDHFYQWGVRNEGFASPFNARLLGKAHGHFYSLFRDTDSVFGSNGSIFDYAFESHGGAWSLDPPFIPETMRKAVDLIAAWRDSQGCPTILLIVPSSFTPRLKPDETVQLFAGIHYYTGLEGVLYPLPVDVCIHRFGDLDGFDAELIKEGYLPKS